MGSIARSGTWDEASSPAATRLARRFEEAWRGSPRHQRPDPTEFLAEPPDVAPAAWLALLRADLNLRWDAGDSVPVEHYRDRYPGLDAETLVALCYEEFCRREEEGRAPFAAEYDERFPDLADRLRRVFDIHELVGNAASTDLHIPEPEANPFPEAGQTIAGFHLVEELGRGSFARVFLARERQLADRPVALKVARSGSREPQTLARLQHTHIVPVHSYRTDPATGLHLLCMPYFGRVTLARLLAEPAARKAPTGSELLEALDQLEPSEPRAEGSAARSTLARLPFARAIAWWGARLAEALAHAHDRGVLHRDIKPSNVLVTGDGLPMLLDFNLAREPWEGRDPVGPDHLGGTLAYMAPEHLEALTLGEGGRVDPRSDVFSLGVLLFESLTGARPFPAPSAGSSIADTLQRAADDRRKGPPRLRAEHPEVPGPLERVIRRCLEPDPAARFSSAADLAADLQAVADDAPLRSTREPWAIRIVRRLRRSRRRLAIAAPAAAALLALASSTLRESQERARIEAVASEWIGEGRQALRLEDFALATARFDAASRMIADRPELVNLLQQARVQHARARETGRVRAEVDAFFRAASGLRQDLVGGDGRTLDGSPAIGSILEPFHVLTDARWANQPELTFLDAPRKARLLRDVDELLFLSTAAIDPAEAGPALRGVRICDRALAFSPAQGPWRALRARLDDAPAPEAGEDLKAEGSALACLEWAALRDRQGRSASAVAWLDRAAWLEPDRAWYRYYRASLLVRAGKSAEALADYDVAIALEPDSAVFRRDRARALRAVGEWARAADDERRAGKAR